MLYHNSTTLNSSINHYVWQYMLTSSITTGIKDLRIKSSTLYIYPNPAKDKLTITVPGNQNKIHQIELVNIYGQLLLTEHHSNTLDISNLDKGLYLLRITLNDSSIEIKKMIKN